MIVLAPIPPLVQDTLYQKIAMLGAGAGKTVGKDENEIWTANNTTANVTADENAENYMFARTPYMVMTSLTPTDDGGPLIIQGGELNSFGEMAGRFDTFGYSHQAAGTVAGEALPVSLKTPPNNIGIIFTEAPASFVILKICVHAR